MNRSSVAKRVQVLNTLMEGVGIRSTVRLTGVAKNTIAKLTRDFGPFCKAIQDVAFKNLRLKRLQCDELWTFCYSKEKNIPEKYIGQPGYGSVWTWVAICPDTKLVPYWLIGDRTAEDAHRFMNALAGRIEGQVQLTTDGYKSYPEAVLEAFGKRADFGTIVKNYSHKDGQGVLEIDKEVHFGRPKEKHISTSLVERQNLTMRMSMRRFTRKTNAHSKKLSYLESAVAIHYMYYNFIRIHETIKTTPAVAANVTDRVWSFAEVLTMMDNGYFSLSHPPKSTTAPRSYQRFSSK